MKKYDSYKDSGIEWIGDIPSHWKAVPMRFLLRQRITDGPHETPKFLPDGIPFLSVDGIQDGELVFEGCRKISIEDHERYKQKCVVEKHDILMGKAASVGKVAQVKVDFEFSIWSPLALLKPNHEKITSSYFEYFLKSTYAKDNANILSTFNTQQNISMTDIPRIYYIIPNSVEEQTAITAYLDRKTAEIDELIADKKRLLELYEEEKTAIINELVTGKKVWDGHAWTEPAEVKDSGIEWLGEIPEHWEVKKIGHCGKIVRGGSPRPTGDPRYFFGDYIHWITVKEVTNAIGKYVVSTEEYLTEEGSKHSRIIEPETLLLSNSGATLGVPKISKIRGCINDGSVAFPELKSFLNRDYLYYFFVSHTDIYREQMAGNGQPNLNTEIIKSTFIPVPSTIEEQTAIVEFIEIETLKVDAKKAKTEKLIELLTEYRTALISEVVTGKVKVI